MSQQYKKICTTCGKEILLSNHTGKWLPYNLDNSPHRCLPPDRKPTQPQQPPAPQPAEVKQEPQPLTLEQIDARLKRVESLLFNEGK